MPEEVFETPQTVEPTAETKPTNWPKIVLVTVLGLFLLLGVAYAGYQYYQLKQEPDDWCSSAKSFGECIDKGCVFVDVGLSNDPQIRNSPWCVPPEK